MKTSRFHCRQRPGNSMFFGFLILFASGTHGQDASLKPAEQPALSVSSAAMGSVSTLSPRVPFPPTKFLNTKMATKDRGSDEAPLKAHAIAESPAATSIDKGAASVSTLPLEEHSTPKHLEPDTVPKQKQTTAFKQIKPADASTEIPTSTDPETTTTVATTTKEMQATKAVGKPPTTIGELATSSPKATTVRSTYLLPRGRKGEKETTTPGQRVQDVTTARNTSSRWPKTHSTTGTSTIKASEADTGVTDDPSKGSGDVIAAPTDNTRDSDPERSAPKDRTGLIVAIVLSILLVLVLLVAILFCWRRRHHSGSTSFRMEGWAGQVALPDDSGLDKELEQEGLTAGEGEARRATLTTFLGKRQSRVPSVAIEEIAEKETGDVEEAQRLIDGDARKVSSLEGSGEANGKIPEPTTHCSQETEHPPPAAYQEQTPPTPSE